MPKFRMLKFRKSKAEKWMENCYKIHPDYTQKQCEDFIHDLARQGKLGGGKRKKSKRKSYHKKSKRKSYHKRKSYYKKSKRKSKRRKSSKRSKRRR